MSLVLAGRLGELLHRLDRDARGDLAGGVAAHAVADDEQVVVGVDAEGVLVVVPAHPHVGEAGVLDRHGRRPMTS